MPKMKIDESDMAYHQRVVERIKQVAQAEQFILSSRGAAESWTGYLRDKYQLGPEANISEDGTIV